MGSSRPVATASRSRVSRLEGGKRGVMELRPTRRQGIDEGLPAEILFFLVCHFEVWAGDGPWLPRKPLGTALGSFESAPSFP